jgi:hypothetical protein
VLKVGKIGAHLGRGMLAAALALSGAAPSMAAIPVAVDPAQSDLIAANAVLLQLIAASQEPQRQTVDRPDPQRPDNPGRTPDGGQRDERTLPISRYTTQTIVLKIRAVERECQDYDPVYRIDCLRQGIEMVARSLPDRGEYGQAKIILKQSANRLARIVEKYNDTTAPKLKARKEANPYFRKQRVYTAVRRDALEQANKEARAVVVEAATALLRSSENSEQRYAHYQTISVAVDSTKTLLRSS